MIEVLSIDDKKQNLLNQFNSFCYSNPEKSCQPWYYLNSTKIEELSDCELKDLLYLNENYCIGVVRMHSMSKENVPKWITLLDEQEVISIINSLENIKAYSIFKITRLEEVFHAVK